MNSHEHFMHIALQQAKEALCAGEFPVGAIIVHEDHVLASGRRKNSRKEHGAAKELDHAEIVALRTLLAGESSVPLTDMTLYSTMEPCLMCYATMLVNGIRRFVYAYEDVMGGGTSLPLATLNPLYQEMEIELVPQVLREDSLRLFKQFFANPNNTYWQDSLLCRYTLEQ